MNIDELIEQINNDLYADSSVAYAEYTHDALSAIRSGGSYDVFNDQMKKLKAKLAQKFSAASKRAKRKIILFYVDKMIAKNPDISSREIESILKNVTGRSTSRSGWSGKLKVKSSASRSKYFTDSEYRNRVYEQEIIKEFSANFDIVLNNIETWKTTKQNSQQSKIMDAISNSKYSSRK